MLDSDSYCLCSSVRRDQKSSSVDPSKLSHTHPMTTTTTDKTKDFLLPFCEHSSQAQSHWCAAAVVRTTTDVERCYDSFFSLCNAFSFSLSRTTCHFFLKRNGNISFFKLRNPLPHTMGDGCRRHHTGHVNVIKVLTQYMTKDKEKFISF